MTEDETTPVQDVMERFWYHAVNAEVDTQSLCIDIMAKLHNIYTECVRAQEAIK